MNKVEFLAANKPAPTIHKLKDGSEVPIRSLSMVEQSKMMKAINKDTVAAHAEIVCMGCDMFTIADLKAVGDMDGKIVKEISDAIIELSGLGDSEERKNS